MNKEVTITTKILHKIFGHFWKPAEKGYAICKVCGHKEVWDGDHRIDLSLSKTQIKFFVEYFHKTWQPDYDGYLGNYCLPEEVMVEYRKKYRKEREWD